MANLISYAIGNPGGKRRTFRIQQVLPDGRRPTMKLEALDTVNKVFLSGLLTQEQARKQVEQIVADLYKARDATSPKRLFHSDNARTLEKYWTAEYSHRDIRKPEDRKTDLKWALAALGAVSIIAGTRQDMQQALLDSLPRTTQRRRAASRLNQMLTWLGRGFTLYGGKPVAPNVKYLTLPELQAVLPHIRSPEFRALCKAAYVSGCRLGELFPITESDLRGNHVWVETQLDREHEERETKTRRRRRAFLLKECRDWMAEWLVLPDRADLRTLQHAKIFTAACRRAFPKRKEKHLVFHDLRHSYAVYLLQVKGAPMQMVANSLGNSVAVCEYYYAGFVLTDPGIDYLDAL